MEDLLNDANIPYQPRYDDDEITIATDITLSEYKQISSNLK